MTYLQLLQIFKQATLVFSKENATVASVIPAMDRIDTMLTTNTTTHKFSPAVRAALAMGKRTLNCYYSRTDDSDVYRTAMGMLNFIFYYVE